MGTHEGYSDTTSNINYGWDGGSMLLVDGGEALPAIEEGCTPS